MHISVSVTTCHIWRMHFSYAFFFLLCVVRNEFEQQEVPSRKRSRQLKGKCFAWDARPGSCSWPFQPIDFQKVVYIWHKKKTFRKLSCSNAELKAVRSTKSVYRKGLQILRKCFLNFREIGRLCSVASTVLNSYKLYIVTAMSISLRIGRDIIIINK